MPNQSPELPYDAFISYSHADAEWVFGCLAPRLKAEGLTLCTDQEAFAVGVPILRNIEDAVAACRHTILVLTEAWVQSRWTQFEALLAQTEDPAGAYQRILPVLRQPCAPPRRIGMLTYADLTGGADDDVEFGKLVAAIRGARLLPDAGSTVATLGLGYDLFRDGRTGEAAEAEAAYRAELVRELREHDFRGIYQIKQSVRLPLAEIYQELGLLKIRDAEEHRRARERLPELDEAQRQVETERRLQERVTGALARSQRLVILGDPGAGKTISLKFIALMLADRQAAARLGLPAPYLPVMVRLAHFAQALEREPALSLEGFLLRAIQQEHDACHPQLADLVRRALGRGACAVLLDGLDEVGEDGKDGQSLRTMVVKQVQKFADRWCTADDRPNRLIITSRIEGYWDEALRGCDHVELSPLSPPDEVEQFLLRWYRAYEQELDPALLPAVAGERAAGRVAGLLPQLMDAPGVKRLATNPLLLTILVLIYENVGRLPNRRAKLYETCTNTLIASWREQQTDRHSRLLDDMGETMVTRLVAALAYWLHEKRPGGTAPLRECHDRLVAILTQDENYDRAEALAIADAMLSYASCEAGLLCERGLGQYGFFHLTFEEYLAAYHLTRQAAGDRRAMLEAHWEDDRWREVILLAAGQLGVVDNQPKDAGAFLFDLRQMEPRDPANAGRPAVLAGRALADIGPRSVHQTVRRDVMRELRQTMQDLDLETDRPNDPSRIAPRTRCAAGEAWDELGGLPEDLDAWVLCPRCADGGGDLLAAKYPVSNVQFERFIQDKGYEDPRWWGGDKSPGWRWRMTEHNIEWRGKGPVTQPEYWQTPRFGKDRHGYPVVGVSWYEAAAYAAWLTKQLEVGSWRLEIVTPQHMVSNLQSLTSNFRSVVRLPTDAEGRRLAGGEREGEKERYPWDPLPDGSLTDPGTEPGRKAILARANTTESEIGGTSPVAMYPLGESKPFWLWDVAGNVWEWTDTWYDEKKTGRVVRGGSWRYNLWLARPSALDRLYPFYSTGYIGFRLVSPISSGF